MKKLNEKEGFQKIGCNVSNCAHNCIEDCTCRLDNIQVCPCSLRGDGTPEDETACSSFINAGNENLYNSKSY